MDCFINTFGNVMPILVKTIRPHQPPWKTDKGTTFFEETESCLQKIREERTAK